MATNKALGSTVKDANRPKVEVKQTRTQILRQKQTHNSAPAKQDGERKNKMSTLETSKIQTKSKSATQLTLPDSAAYTRHPARASSDALDTKGDSLGVNKRKATKTVTIKHSLSPRTKRREISSSPVQSPNTSRSRGTGLHSHLTGDQATRPIKHGTLSSMGNLSDSRSSIQSDASNDSFTTKSASGSGSKSSSSQSHSDLLDRRYSVKSTSSSHSDSSKSLTLSAQLVTDRLYQSTKSNEKGNFLRRKYWDTSKPQRRARKDGSSSRKKKLSVVKASSTEDIDESCRVYDWLNRSAHSDTDVTIPMSLNKKLKRKARRRRHSDPLGCKNGPCFVEYDHDIDDGFRREGVRFLREYFCRDLVWLTNMIDLFLSNRNLFPVYPVTTNTEWYVTVTRPSFYKPRTQEDLYDISAATDKVKVDAVDSLNDVADITTADDIIKLIEESIPQMVDAWTETWQRIIMCDVATMTVRPRMCNKTTLTEPIYCDQQTSTDDMSSLNINKSTIVKIKCEQATSTADMLDDVYDGSPTPTSSPADDAESSAYGSYESGNLRKQLQDKSEGFSQTESEFSLNIKIEKKTGLTEEDTTRIQSELNRLVRERIEIIELFTLNIGNMSVTFTEELLETKLNYSIGQTDQLLALLEEAWNFEDAATSTPRDHGMCSINYEIIQQSRNELKHSKQVIKLCIDELREINNGGSRHSNFHEEIQKMKRKAEIEAFKLERMWEQLAYKRSKKRTLVSEFADHKHNLNTSRTSSSCGDPAYSTFEQHANYLSDLRNRTMLAASQEDIRKVSSSISTSTTDCMLDMHGNRSTLNDSVDSYIDVPGYITPKGHKDHLTELRRLLIADYDQTHDTSKSSNRVRPVSESTEIYNNRRYSSNPRSSGNRGVSMSPTRVSHAIYPSNRAYTSYGNRLTHHSPDRYRTFNEYSDSFAGLHNTPLFVSTPKGTILERMPSSTSHTSRSTLYSTPWSTYRDSVPITSSYDKYKQYTGTYQTTIN